MTVNEINEKLHRLYGREKATGYVKYRVVWSGNEIEKRKGSYKVFTDSGIYLRDEYGVRTIKKYWNVPDCWVLERAEPNSERQELIVEKVVYEPLFTFLDAKNEPLELSWKPIELIIFALEKAEKKKLDAEALAKQEAEYNEMLFNKGMDILMKEDTLPTFQSSSLLSDTKKVVDKDKNLVTLT